MSGFGLCCICCVCCVCRISLPPALSNCPAGAASSSPYHHPHPHHHQTLNTEYWILITERCPVVCWLGVPLVQPPSSTDREPCRCSEHKQSRIHQHQSAAATPPRPLRTRLQQLPYRRLPPPQHCRLSPAHVDSRIPSGAATVTRQSKEPTRAWRGADKLMRSLRRDG